MSSQDWVFWLGFACGAFTTCFAFVWIDAAWQKYKRWKDSRDCTCGLSREKRDG